MGVALTLWVALLAGALPQGTPLDALRRENTAIHDQLKEAGAREEGRRALHAFVERLSADPQTDPAALYHRAKELAADCLLTPDPLERARWYDVAAVAVARTGAPETALSMQEERARLLVALGALDEAAVVLEAALDRHPDARARRPHALVALAEVLRRLGRFDAALERIREVDAIVDAPPAVRVAQDSALLVRSAIARDVGSPELLEAELEALARDVDARLARGEVEASHASSVRIEMLRVAIAQGDHARVRSDAQALLDDPVLCRADAERAQVLLHLGAAWLELERGERESGSNPERRARAFFEEALRLGSDPAEQFFVRTRLATEALESGDIARCQAEVNALRDISADSVPLTTRVEGAVLEAQLALAQAAPEPALLERRADLLRAWEDLAGAWRSAPRDAQGVAFLKYSHRRAVLSQLAQLEMVLQPGEAGVARAFEHLLAAQELSTLAAARPGERVTLAALRRDLLTGARHGLLVYLPARDRSHVFAVDRDAITHHTLARSSRLEEVRMQYVAWLLLGGVERSSGEQRAELVREERARAAALAAALLPDDVRARVRGWEQWSISGTDTLGLVPFEWLPFEAERYLGSRRAIDLVPSLPHAVRTAARGPAAVADLDLVLVADARPSAAVEAAWPGLERVELGAESRATLDSLYGPDRLRVLAADHARATDIAQLDFEHVAVLQFLVHAVEERGAVAPVAFALSPDGSLADDGLFRAEAIARLHGAPALVVLTACGSGQGPTRRGDPLIGSAAGAWLSQGARAVLVSQHELTLREARRTTRVLHAALRRGATPAEALRDVRRDLEGDEPELAPFLHAMQQVIGLGHRPLFARAPRDVETSREDDSPPTWPAKLLLVAIALVTGVGLAFLRRARAGSGTSGRAAPPG